MQKKMQKRFFFWKNGMPGFFLRCFLSSITKCSTVLGLPKVNKGHLNLSGRLWCVHTQPEMHDRRLQAHRKSRGSDDHCTEFCVITCWTCWMKKTEKKEKKKVNAASIEPVTSLDKCRIGSVLGVFSTTSASYNHRKPRVLYLAWWLELALVICPFYFRIVSRLCKPLVTSGSHVTTTTTTK
jgi:hypothetical protein